MANRKRNIQMKFWVTEEEKRLIDEKMKQLPTQRYGAYLRKMAIDGYIIHTRYVKPERDEQGTFLHRPQYQSDRKTSECRRHRI